jgi:hypothetical protein
MTKKSGNKSLRKQKIKNKEPVKPGVKTGKPGKKSFRKYYIGLGAVLIAISILFLDLENGPLRFVFNQIDIPSAAGLPPNTPRVTVDREKIDFGKVEYNIRKTFAFTVINSGNDVLKFERNPHIEVVEGC